MPEGGMQALSLRPRADSNAAQPVALPCGGSPGSPGVPAHLRVRTVSRLGGAAASGGAAAESCGRDGAAASPHGPSPRERNAFFSADPPPQPPPLDLDGGLGAQPPPPPSTQPRRSGMRRSSLGGPDAPKPRAGVSFAASIEDVSVFAGSPKHAHRNPSAAEAAAADAEDAAERQEQGATA